MKNTNLPTIVSGSKDTILQKEQRLFNKLITQISNKRELLIWWDRYLKSESTWEKEAELRKDGIGNIIDQFLADKTN